MKAAQKVQRPAACPSNKETAALLAAPPEQNPVKNPGPCLRGLPGRNCSAEVTTLTEPAREVSGDHAESQREQLSVTEAPLLLQDSSTTARSRGPSTGPLSPLKAEES